MSSSSFTGTISNFSPKPNEDYYGILVDNGEEEKWLNGKGSIPDHWEKGDKVKIKANMDRFIEIDEINVMEAGETNQGGNKTSDKSAQQSGDKPASNNSYTDKNHSIQAQKALDLAERRHHDDEFSSEGEATDQILTTADGFFNWLKEKSQKGERE